MNSQFSIHTGDGNWDESLNSYCPCGARSNTFVTDGYYLDHYCEACMHIAPVRFPYDFPTMDATKEEE